MKKQIRSNIEKLTNTKIENIGQVYNFITGCMSELKLNFHPDTPFGDYIGRYNVPAFSNAEQDVLESSLMECFQVCESKEIDIYAICLEVRNENLGHMEKSEKIQGTKRKHGL